LPAVRLTEDFFATPRDPVERGLVARDFVGRDVLELAPVEDFLELDRWLFVSPFSRRSLLTVRAATSSARPPYRPDFLALCLMCSYCRSRFGLAPLGIQNPPFLGVINTYLKPYIISVACQEP
jgi:hypothetical protein